MVDYTNYGLDPLDLSGVGNIYEQSSLPMHGYAEAQQQAVLRERIRRMKRAQMLMRASGLNIPDYTSSLNSMLAGIKPEQTRAQAEKAQQLKILGEAIRTHKPRNERQVEQLIISLGLNPALAKEAKAMAANFSYGSQKEYYGLDAAGDLQVIRGHEGDPDVQAQLETGDYGGKFAYEEREEEFQEDEVSAALQAVERASPDSMKDLEAFFVEQGKKWNAKEYQKDEIPFNPYDLKVREAIYSHFSKVAKAGEKRPLYWLERGDDKVWRVKTKMVAVGDDKYFEQKSETKTNAVTNKEDLGLTGGMDEQWNAAQEKALLREGGIEAQFATFKQHTAGLYTPDRNKKNKEFLEQASKPAMTEYSLQKARVETLDAMRKHLNQAQVDEYWPLVQDAITQGISTIGDTPVALDTFVRQVLLAAIPEGQLSQAAEDDIIKKVREEITWRRDALKFGLDVETSVQNLTAGDLSITRAKLELRKIVAESVYLGQANNANQVIDEAFQAYKQKKIPSNKTLSVYIREKMEERGIIIALPDAIDKINTRIRQFETDFLNEQNTRSQIDKRQMEMEGEVPSGGVLWDATGDPKAWKTIKEKNEILAGGNHVYPTDPTLMSASELAKYEGRYSEPVTMWDEFGNFRAAANKLELTGIMEEGFNQPTNPTQLSAADQAKIAGEYPESGVLWNAGGDSESYKDVGGLNKLLDGAEFVYKTNPLDDKTVREIGASIRSIPGLKQAVDVYEEVYFKYQASMLNMQSVGDSQVPGIHDLPMIDMWKKITDESMITQEELMTYLATQGWRDEYITTLEGIKTGALLSGPQRKAMIQGIHHALRVRGAMLESKYAPIKEFYDAKYPGKLVFESAFLPTVKQITPPDFTLRAFQMGTTAGQGERFKITPITTTVGD